jgi:hypothetical protein
MVRNVATASDVGFIMTLLDRLDDLHVLDARARVADFRLKASAAEHPAFQVLLLVHICITTALLERSTK